MTPQGVPSSARVPHGATAQRPHWSDLPQDVRSLVEARLGQAVLTGHSQGGGFTDGFASRLELADRSGVFVKAVSSVTSPIVHAAYLQEARISQALPAAVPAPDLLWWVESGSWVVLAFAEIPGRCPSRPWRPDELAAVLAILPGMAAALTPAPVGMGRLPTTRDLDGDFSFWRQAAAGSVDVDVRPAWWSQRESLVALESEWAALAAGATASHFDLRDDNLLLTPDGQVLVCDWNWLTLAAPWVDLVSLLISAHGDGLDADAILGEHLHRAVPARAVNAFLAALGGYFLQRAAQPPLPHSPWLRVGQAWWRDATMSWLMVRLG